jgi:hypothetical protein
VVCPIGCSPPTLAQLTLVPTGRVLKKFILWARVSTRGGAEKTLIAEQIAVGSLAETWLAFQQPGCQQKLSQAVNDNLGLEDLSRYSHHSPEEDIWPASKSAIKCRIRSAMTRAEAAIAMPPLSIGKH